MYTYVYILYSVNKELNWIELNWIDKTISLLMFTPTTVYVP